MKDEITRDKEKDPRGNSVPVMSVGDGQDLEILSPPQPPQKMKLIKLREFFVACNAKCRRKPLISEEKNRL